MEHCNKFLTVTVSVFLFVMSIALQSYWLWNSFRFHCCTLRYLPDEMASPQCVWELMWAVLSLVSVLRFFWTGSVLYLVRVFLQSLTALIESETFSIIDWFPTPPSSLAGFLRETFKENSLIVIKSVIINPDWTDMKSIVFKYHTLIPEEIIFHV